MALFFKEAAEEAFLAAREKIRSFEHNVATRLTKAEQHELARLLAKLQGNEPDGAGQLQLSARQTESRRV